MKGLKGEIDQRPRRFYGAASVEPGGGGWVVTLDGRPLRTPEKRALALPTQQLAQAIADEWAAQGERIDLQSMFNTRLANVAIDRTPAVREEMAGEAAGYARTDLTCHLADSPASLRQRQEAAWGPLRDWAGETLGVRLSPVVGVIAADQPAESIEAVRRHALSLDDFRLSALVHATALAGSVVLGLAVERRRITAEQAHELSRIDEAFQASLWGEDAEARTRADRMLAEARALNLWFDALG